MIANVDQQSMPKTVCGKFPNPNPHNNPNVYISLQVLLLAVLLTLWTDIPSNGWQDHVRVTSRFTQVLSLTWFKSNRYHSHPKTVVSCKLLQDNSKFSFVEVFAGQAEITRMFRYANLPAIRLDLAYMQPEPGRQNPMDLLSDAGMGNLGIIWVRIYVWTWFIISEPPSKKHHNLDQSISYFYALLQLVAKDSFGSYASR